MRSTEKIHLSLFLGCLALFCLCLGWASRASYFVLAAGLVMLVQMGEQWWARVQEERIRNEAKEEARRILQNLEIRRVLVHRLTDIGLMIREFEMIFEEIETLRELLENARDHCSPKPDELLKDYSLLKGEMILDSALSQTQTIVMEAKKSAVLRERITMAREAVRTIDRARRELWGFDTPALEIKRREITIFLRNCLAAQKQSQALDQEE